MATVQFQIISVENDLVRVVLEYDDVTFLLSGVRSYNNSGQSIYISVIRTSDGRMYAARLAPGERTISIPTTGANRVVITDLGRGHFGGIDRQSAFPG